jgi:hypothetical protein
MRPGTPDTSFSSALPTIDVTGFTLDQTDLINAQMPDDDFVDLSYFIGDYTENGERGHEEHQLNLTNFVGDNDDQVRGENTLNRAVKKEGTIRRAISRKKESLKTKRASETRLIRSQGRSLTYQQIPRGLVNSSHLRSPALWQILLFQAAMPLDDICRLPDLRFFLYTLLHHLCNGRPLLLGAIYVGIRG